MRKFLAFGLLFLMFSAPLAAQGTGTESITGHVLPAAGEQALPPTERMVVRVQRQGTADLQVVSVRDGGRFDVSGLSRGHYEITVECPGYRPGRTQVVLNPVGAANSTIVYVNLGPRDLDKNPGTGTVDVASLAVPQKARDELVKAAAAHEARNPEKAIEHLQKAIEIHPDYVEAHNQLTGQYLTTQPPQVDKAVESASRSVEIQPENNAVAFRYLGLIQLQRQEYGEAAQNLKASYDQDPAHAPTAFSLGRAYTALQKPEEAVAAFEAAVEADPDNTSYRFGLGYAYFLLKRYPEAARELNKMLEAESEGQRADMARQLLDQISKGGGK